MASSAVFGATQPQASNFPGDLRNPDWDQVIKDLNSNRASDITKPHRKINSGYASTFENVTKFEGRIEAAANWSDLTGSKRLAKKDQPAKNGRPGKKGRPGKPWLNGLPRLIFVSDMGDALSNKSDFDFLHNELASVESELGRRHLWLWLTKRPQNMRLFAEEAGGLPDNVCAMTTVTSDKALGRVDELRRVEAAVKGLSVEPLWSPVADKIDLEGIDWVIVGGESGGMNRSKPFAIEWARELRDLCADQDVAFFCKQLGRIPTEDGKVLKLSHSHGSEWDEWPADLRVREFPQYFHDYARVAVTA